MKYTLLDLVQNVLSSMDSDEVNSISDTVESQQVVKIIKAVYDDILSRSGVTVNKTLFNLVSSGSSLKPILMSKPDSIDSIEWVKYNAIKSGDTDPSWRELNYLDPEDFMRMTHSLLPSDSSVSTMTYTTTEGFIFDFSYRTDIPPTYYTVFDDVNMIFDSIDMGVDTTLQTSKTLCYGSLATVFTEVDGFVPNLQPQQFGLLLNEAKSLAWSELKQMPHAKAEVTARRNWRHLSKATQQIPMGKFGNNAQPIDQLPYFGRK